MLGRLGIKLREERGIWSSPSSSSQIAKKGHFHCHSQSHGYGDAFLAACLPGWCFVAGPDHGLPVPLPPPSPLPPSLFTPPPFFAFLPYNRFFLPPLFQGGYMGSSSVVVNLGEGQSLVFARKGPEGKQNEGGR